MKKFHSSLENNAFVSLGLAIALVFILIGMVTRSLVQISYNVEEIVAANEIVDTASQLMDQLVDIETGERGYIITGNDAYLGPHLRGLSRVYLLRDKLMQLTRNEPSIKSILDELNRRIDSKIKISRTNVEARKRSFDEARKLVETGTGLSEMDGLRSVMDKVIEAQRQRRDSLRDERRKMMLDLKLRLELIAIAFFVVLFLMHWRFQRLLEQKHETEEDESYSNLG